MPAVHVQRVLREGPRGHLQDHRGALAGSVVILLDAVDDALARGVVDDPLAADRIRDRATLRGVLAWWVHRLYHGSRLPCARRRLLVNLVWLLGSRGRDPVALLPRIEGGVGAIDPVPAAEILNLFRIMATQGTTVVIATHEADIARVIDRRIEIADGSVVSSQWSVVVSRPPNGPRTTDH